MSQSRRHGLELIYRIPNTLPQILRVHSYDLLDIPFAPTHDRRVDYKLRLASFILRWCIMIIPMAYIACNDKAVSDD
jgi:hypothetical protein